MTKPEGAREGGDPSCPKCSNANLAVERRLNGNATCLTAGCGWEGPYSDCFRKEAKARQWWIQFTPYEEFVWDDPLLADRPGAVHVIEFSALEDAQRQIAELKAELETERMRLAACGVASLGYYKEPVADEFKSASLSDTLRLQASNSRLREALKDIEMAPRILHPNTLINKMQDLARAALLADGGELT